MIRQLWAAVLPATAAALLGRAWSGWFGVATLVAALLMGYALSLLGARLRLPGPAWALALTAAAGIAAHMATAAHGGLVDAVPRMLTAGEPIPVTVASLVPGALVAALVGVCVGALAARDGGGTLAAPTGAAVLYLGGALLTAGSADRHGLGALALLLLAGLGWAAVDRRWRASTPVLLLCAMTALVGGRLPLADPFEPRDLVRLPVLTLTEPSPLPRLSAWARHGDDELLRVRSASPVRLRLVTLVDFTGASWRTASDYYPLGAVERTGPTPGAKSATVQATITVSNLTGPWLPSPGWPLGSSLAEARVEPQAGTLVWQPRLARGLRYDVRGQVDTPGPAEVAAAGVPDGPETEPWLATPRLPVPIADYAYRATTGAGTRLEQAQRIEQVVRAGRRFDPEAPTGSSYARLDTFLFGKAGTPGAQAGSSEQFASAFVLLARAVGLPARLVVGFREGEAGPDGQRVVRGRDVLAWPEVYFSGAGWAPFDPTPLVGGPGASTSRDDSAGRPVPPPAPAPVAPVTPEARPREPDSAGGWWAPVGAALGVAVSLAGLAVVALRAARRRRHRRAGVGGAWSEVLDLLVLLGRRPPASASAPAVAADLAALAPKAAGPATLLAVAADRAAFAPPGLAAAAAGDSWRRWLHLRREVRRVVPWRRRALWAVDPRPLFRP
ncbi:transglutaminaseTgpA domain-containing protein [Longispora fulva]|uniref:transglutaminaseTgpA domain-containing protein n=1 Tax=Longispora fulva TaxID=619741 RepID=UPI003632A7F9